MARAEELLNEVAKQWHESPLTVITIASISADLQAWIDLTYSAMPPVAIPDEWMDIGDWGSHEAGTSIHVFYPKHPDVDAATWVRVRQYKFRNTGYNDETYFYAPITLVEPLMGE
jgi:hypothetical protein